MDFQANYPIYLQIAEDVKRRIVIGELKPGDKLPSNAELAIAYQVNPNTVQRIYRQLEAEGISYTKRGIGTFLAEDPAMPERLRQEIGEKLSAQFLRRKKSIKRLDTFLFARSCLRSGRTERQRKKHNDEGCRRTGKTQQRQRHLSGNAHRRGK